MSWKGTEKFNTVSLGQFRNSHRKTEKSQNILIIRNQYILFCKPFQRADCKVRSIPYLHKETLLLGNESLPVQCHVVEKFSILQNQSRAVSVTSTSKRSRIQNKSKCFSKLPCLWQLKLLIWWKEIIQFHTNNKTRAVQTSVLPLERNLLKQIEPKTKWWLRGVCWVNNFCKPIFRFLFVEITFNSHILTQIYESFCIILSLLLYDNIKYVSARGSFE